MGPTNNTCQVTHYDKSKRNGVGHRVQRIGGLTDVSNAALGYTGTWSFRWYTNRHLKGAEKTVMEFLLVSVLILMLVAVAYAQWQRGVVRTIGKLSLDEDETDHTVR